MRLLSADTINGVFEALGAVFTWKNALQLYRDREIKGVYWPAWIFFAAWGLWNLYYYPALGQWMSFGAGVLLVSGNLAWVALAVRLWLRKRSELELERILTAPRDETPGPSVNFDWGSAPGTTSAGVTTCAACGRYWVPGIYGPRSGESCPSCNGLVTAVPEQS